MNKVLEEVEMSKRNIRMSEHKSFSIQPDVMFIRDLLLCFKFFRIQLCEVHYIIFAHLQTRP